MARINPLGKIKDVALGTLLHPIGTAEKAVEQAKGTAAIGRMVAGQVARTAASAAAETVGGVARRAGGSASGDATPEAPAARATGRATRGDEPNLRSVPDVNEPAHTPAPVARRTRKAASSTKNHGDQLAPVAEAVEKAVEKAPAKKAPAKTTPAKKTPAKKAAAKTATSPAKKAAKKTAGSDADLTTKRTPAKKLAAQGLDDVTPADVAKVAKKTPTKKTTPVTPVDEQTAKKAAKKTAKKTARKTAEQAAETPGNETPAASTRQPPRTASEVANEEGPEVTTPVGTTAAGESALPNTDLQQPGTEPLMDPATVKAVKSETETLQRAADPDKG